jgi:hypothetical protein
MKTARLVYSKVFSDFDATAGGIIAKWNSSGTLQYQKKIELTYGTIGLGGVFVDATNNYVYYCALGNPTTNGILVKYDTNLSQQWGTYLTTGVGASIRSVAVATSSQNVYAYTSAGSPGVAKYNSSGSLQWQIQFSAGGGYQQIAVDSSENSYVQMNATSGIDGYIIKVNSSGSIAGQLEFAPTGTGSGTSDNMGGVAITGNSIFSAMNTYHSTSFDGVAGIKILNSMSTTGAYGRITMSSSSVTASTSSLTTGSTTPTVSTTSYATGSSLVTGSDATSSFTRAITLI